MSLSVLIPTFRRPDGLSRALVSVFAQTRAPDEIVVVDNAPEGGARAVIDALAPRSPAGIVHVHEPSPGVANARNAGFAAARGRHIAQLDDDESASPDWLQRLMETRERLDAPVVFGPVAAQAPQAGALRRAYVTRLYSRSGPGADSVLTKPYGCGNSLIDRAAAPLPAEPFDPATNETGGEDDLLFARLAARGTRFAWSARAHVVEHVDPRRARWAYLMARSFAYGQGPSQACVTGERVRPLRLAAWMGIGAAQMAVFGAAALPARLAGAEAAAACLDRAVQGAGKVLWMDAFGPRFYGAAHA
ncbi:glycosyltransferase [Marinicauda algicola]|uniref:Glycosyltransferase n=1 Tax=Marinicauda algicola TaxID=2029849 RepID=A0A4S2GXL0_9PROT|nr:glycosyltransferase family 2 protein [Marinicauda algicola]TGY87793.1 glycosyltransferase [Marinicauda algicola]